MTAQQEILTGVKGYVDERGYLNANIFYGASRQKILDNWERALDVYTYTLGTFIRAWVETHEDGYPPCEWKELAI